MSQSDAVTWYWSGWYSKALVNWWQVYSFHLHSSWGCVFTLVITWMYFVPTYKISNRLWVGTLQIADFIQWNFMGSLLRWFCLWGRQIQEVESKNDWISAKLLSVWWSNSIEEPNNRSTDFNRLSFQNHPRAAGSTVVHWSSNGNKYIDVYNSERG